MPAKEMLTQEQVGEVVKLWHRGFGNRRIAKCTGLEFEAVRRIVRGRAYRKFTGGRLAMGVREHAKWRGGRTSFEP